MGEFGRGKKVRFPAFRLGSGQSANDNFSDDNALKNSLESCRPFRFVCSGLYPWNAGGNDADGHLTGSVSALT